MRLIDADVLWDVFREKQNSLTARCGGYRFLDSEDRAKYDRLEITLAYIENAPEVDVVPVVRCGECAKQFMPDCPLQYIEKHEQRFICQKDDDFCSYGEKMEDKT